MKKYVRKDKIYLTKNLKLFKKEHGIVDEETNSRKVKSIYKKKLSDLNFMDAMEINTIQSFKDYDNKQLKKRNYKHERDRDSGYRMGGKFSSKNDRHGGNHRGNNHHGNHHGNHRRQYHH